MTLFAFSINHTNASIEVRERMAVTPQRYAAVCHSMNEIKGAHGFFLLSTCNRTEIYATCTDGAAFSSMVENFAAYSDVTEKDLHQAMWLEGDEAFCHLLRVACGMHSMVLGEPQIFGQIKSAYSLAKRQGTTDSELEQLVQYCFGKVKEIRTGMPLGREPVSIVSTMVKVLQQIFDDFGNKRLLLVGAGETIELATRYLVNLGTCEITITNRSIENAQQLAERYAAKAAPIYDLPELLASADLLITATASQLPIIGKGMVESAMARRKGNLLVMFDLAVPRDIESQVGALDGVYLYSIDDLGSIVEQNKQSRQQASRAAENLLQQALVEYRQQQLLARLGREVISPLRNHVEQLRDQELTLAMAQLARGEMPEFVLFQMAHNLTKKILHQPSVLARKTQTSDTMLQESQPDTTNTNETRH